MVYLRRLVQLAGLVTSLLLLAACGAQPIQQITALPDRTASPVVLTESVVTPTRAVTDMLATPSATQAAQIDSTATPVAVNTSTAAEQVRSVGTSILRLTTNTPAPNVLRPGEARSLALATDAARIGDTSPAADGAPVSIQFSEFYSGFSVRTGLQFTDKLKSLDGKPVVIEGYVAPPLKPRLDFFVLTRIQLAFCPFCSTDVEWPDDIALVYMTEPDIISSQHPVRITGRLYTGPSIDGETGMVSLVRIYAEQIEILN